MSPISRRSLLCYSGIASSSILLPRMMSAQAPFDAARTTELVTPETRQAIERGLAWLARRQVVSGREEGAFGHGGYAGGGGTPPTVRSESYACRPPGREHVSKPYLSTRERGGFAGPRCGDCPMMAR